MLHWWKPLSKLAAASPAGSLTLSSQVCFCHLVHVCCCHPTVNMAIRMRRTGSYIMHPLHRPACACAHAMFHVGQAVHALTRQKHRQLGTSHAGAIQHAVQHLPGSVATQSRFPRPRTDLKIALSHSPPSVHSTGTSMLANAGKSLFKSPWPHASTRHQTPHH